MTRVGGDDEGGRGGRGDPGFAGVAREDEAQVAGKYKLTCRSSLLRIGLA